MKKILSILALTGLSASAMAADLPQKYVLNADLAQTIANEAIAECRKSKANVSVSLVNDQGRLVYFYRGDDTGSNTIHTSFRKAYTAASLKAPTSALSEVVEIKGLSQLGKMEDDILLLTGGLPIQYKGSVIGAIGLSGSPNPQLEEDCGKKAIKTVMKN